MTVATASKEVIKSPKLRESRFDDHAQVVALEQRYDLESKPFEEWKSLWTANPAFRRMEEPCEIGWVLEDEFGRVLGYLGNIPLEYEFQGRRILAATTRAWVIDSQYRSLSVLLLNRFFAQPRTELFVNTTVNAAASAAYSIFRALRVPSGKWDQSSFWITNYRGFAKSLLAMKEVFLAEQLSIPASFAFAGVDVFHRGIRRSSRLGLDLVELDHFNSDFDVFWDELRSQNYNKLVAVRDRETLDWLDEHSFCREFCREAAWECFSGVHLQSLVWLLT